MKLYFENLGWVLLGLSVAGGLIALAAGIVAGLYKLYSYSPILAAIASVIGFAAAAAAVITLENDA